MEKHIGLLIFSGLMACYVSIIPGIVVASLIPHPFAFGAVFLITWAGCFKYIETKVDTYANL
jgi:hypothetical protein